MSCYNECGWAVQNKEQANLSAAQGVALREVSMKKGHGEVDYLLFVDGRALGTIEAKPEGHSLTGVEEQSAKYVTGLPFGVPFWRSPLPFSYESTGTETCFTSRLDPDWRSRNLFAFHRPETLLAWAQADKPLSQRLRELPPLITDNLWKAQIQAIKTSNNLSPPTGPAPSFKWPRDLEKHSLPSISPTVW